jgi:hypothetical protein
MDDGVSRMLLGRRPNIPKPFDRARLGNQRGITPTAR